MYMYVLRDNAV